MKSYRVHLYVQVRVPIYVEVPEGTSDEDLAMAAEEKASEGLHDNNLPAFGNPDAEYTGVIDGYVIDPLLPDGAVDFNNSRWLKWEGLQLVKWEG